MVSGMLPSGQGNVIVLKLNESRLSYILLMYRLLDILMLISSTSASLLLWFTEIRSKDGGYISNFT